MVEGRGVETGAFADRLEAFFSAASQFGGRCQDATCLMLAQCSVSLLGDGAHRCDLCRGQQLRMSQVLARVMALGGRPPRTDVVMAVFGRSCCSGRCPYLLLYVTCDIGYH